MNDKIDKNDLEYKGFRFPAWILALAIALFVLLLTLTYFMDKRFTISPFGWINNEYIPEFEIITLTYSEHIRGNTAARAFVKTESKENYILCQLRTAGNYANYVQNVFCHPHFQNGMDGVLIHVQLKDALTEKDNEFFVELLLHQFSARNYSPAILLK